MRAQCLEESDPAVWLSAAPALKLVSASLLDVALALEVFTLNKVRYLIIVVVFLVLAFAALLEALVALGQLAEGSERIGAELVEDTGNELGELLVLAGAVDGESVGWNRSVN